VFVLQAKTGTEIAVLLVLQPRYGTKILIHAAAPMEPTGMVTFVSVVLPAKFGTPKLIPACVPLAPPGMA